MNVVAYTDGGCKPNPGKQGSGIHGYFYENYKRKNAISNNVITDIGYIKKSNLKKIECKEVEPLSYFDIMVTFDKEGTNNTAELYAVLEFLKYLQDKEINKITIILDSIYVKTILENMYDKKYDLNKNKANIEIIKPIYDLLNNIKCDINFIKVKGHDGELGNELADTLASMAIANYGKYETITKESEVKNYWNKKLNIHPLVEFVNRIIYLDIPKEIKTDNEFMVIKYEDEIDIGKYTADAVFGIVYTKADNFLQDILFKYKELLGTTSILSTFRLDTLKKPFNLIYSNLFKLKFFIVNNKQLELKTPDNEKIIYPLKPAGLAMRIYNEMGMFKNMLKESNSLLRNITYEYKEIDNKSIFKINNIIDKKEIKIYDLTPVIFDNKFKLQNHMNKVKMLKVQFNLNNDNNKILLYLGKDIPNRNLFKKLEKLNPKIFLVVIKVTNNLYRYGVIINVSDAISIWGNPFINVILKK